MTLSLNNFKIYIVFINLVILTGCFDKPDKFVAPSWETEMNFSVTEKSFTLLEIVEKDSSFLKSSNNPETLGLLYIGDTQAVSSIRIEDELKIKSFETDFSQKIGPIKNIIIPATDKTDIRVEDWATNVTSGSYQIFPEQEGNVTLPIEGISSIESIQAETGNLRIFVRNNLPVPIELRGITIRNVDDQSVVAKKSDSNPNEWITIPAFLTKDIFFSIENKYITNNLEYVGKIYSHGSSGEEIQVPEEAGTEIIVLFSDLTIGRASALLPEQSFNFNETIVLGDSTKIEEAIINHGKVILTTSNNMGVSLTANITFDNLFDDNGENYTLQIPLNRNQQSYVNEIDLQKWKIATATPGIPTNEISYSVSVNTDSTGEISTISKDDDIAFNLRFEELVFESFTGQLKPTVFNLENTGIKLDYGDINEKFEFQEINFDGAEFKINLNASTDMNLLINGKVEATNGTITNYQSLEDIYIPSVDPVNINISNLINGFSQDLPDSFSIIGTGLLNPNYEVSTINRGDSVYGFIEYEIPLNMGIAGGRYIDTLDIDLGNIDEDDTDNLNYGMVKFIIENTIPIGLSFRAAILDSAYTNVLNLPTPSNKEDSISIPKPMMSQNGELLSSGKNEIELSLEGEEIQKLLNNPYLLIVVNFSTAGNNNIPVKFKTSYGISVKVKAHAEYKVEL